MNQRFSQKEAISFGWNTTKTNLAFFIIISLTLFILQIIPAVVRQFTGNQNTSVVIINSAVAIIFWLINLVTSMGVIKISLKFIDNQSASYSDLFSQFHLFFRYLLGSILYGLIVMAGLILLIIPGIIWGIKFQFFSYSIIDQDLGPVEALKRSWIITSGVKWRLFVFNITLGLINLLGLLALGVGLLVTVPTTSLAAAYVYRQLSKS